ncbi:MAG: hypothetical protein ABII01_05010 [Candidatus Woesearchaeota archaeon]
MTKPENTPQGSSTPRDTADYEASEAAAIASGKRAFERASWLFDRRNDRTNGFFVELRDDPINPDFSEAHGVDGNGTKLFLSAWAHDYRSCAIDGIAMNANDLATVLNVFPKVIDIYLACQTHVEQDHMGEIMNGFVDALEMIKIPFAPWNLNIGKLETASLDEMISLGIQGHGVDFGIVMSGLIRKDRIPNLDPQPGQYIVGVTSSGLHSNGYTGARHALFVNSPKLEPRAEWQSQYHGKYMPNDTHPILEGKTILEAMAVPTALYLVEAAIIGQQFDTREIYGVNITGNGLHNFNRVGKDVAFEITDPLDPHPIHQLLAQESGWTPEQAYTKQNMGMGFAYVVPDLDTTEAVVRLINDRGENQASIVGQVRENSGPELKTILHYPDERKPLEFIGYSN